MHFLIHILYSTESKIIMETISLNSRYGHKVFLKKISKSKYKLDGTFMTLQLTKDFEGNIIAVDPDGGPMISVGDHIREGLVSKIIEDEDSGIIITL